MRSITPAMVEAAAASLFEPHVLTCEGQDAYDAAERALWSALATEAKGSKAYTVAVDFDGVLHSYTSPWVAPHVIPDPPVEGAMEWTHKMAAKFNLAILTTRGQTREGCDAVAEYMTGHGGAAPWLVTAIKVPALVYVDDRGWRFNGQRFPSVQDVHMARPWNKL